MGAESRLLSKCLIDNDISQLSKYNMGLQDFRTQRSTYEFILQYRKDYGGLMPTPETVMTECPAFEHDSDVADHIIYLVKQVKNEIAKLKTYELIQERVSSKYSELSGIDFVDWLVTESQKIKEQVGYTSSAGTNYATNGKERLAMYNERKVNIAGTFIPTPFPTLNEYLDGGFELTDYILLQASTNVGKSWMSTAFAVTAWKNNFGVLYYSPELSRPSQLNRIDTVNGHFSNTGLKKGNLYAEDKYLDYLGTFNEENTTPFIVKCMEDIEGGLSVELIEADLKIYPDIKFVVIDGFNLMVHRGKDSLRNNMTKTSRELRQLFSIHAVAGLIVHQAKTADKSDVDADEAALILNPPGIEHFTETRALSQDACTILGLDAKDGVGRMLLAKSRTAVVGKTIDLYLDFDKGYLREAEAIDMF